MDELTREFLIESQEGLERMERCLTELEERPDDGELLAEIFRAVHTIKGTTGFLGFSRLERLAHAGENLLGMLRDGKLRVRAEIITVLLCLLDALRDALRSIEETGGEGPEAGDEEIIATLNALQAGDGAAQMESAAGPMPSSASSPRPGSGMASELPLRPAAEEANGPRSRANAMDSTLRVDVDLLNRMMNLVGELVLTRNQILRMATADASMETLTRRLDMVTADLRESVMKARMQPVGHVFSKYPRMVRDLAQSLGKRVRLEMEGQETELDKSLLEAIKDPLTHAVRNSLDHGIEAPHVRERSGKSGEGVLRLRAYQESGHVVLEVSDDGAGIRVERIREKAIERGLLTPEKAAPMSERELLQVIFLPGFSTAEAVTHVSGRGVGMDVVRTNVEKIGGKVEIESRAGEGTTLRLQIPLTLAIVPALIVGSRGQRFALSQAVLLELVHLSHEQVRTQIEWLNRTPVYRLRGRILPVVFLGEMLRQPKREAGAEGVYIAVLESDGRRFGLIVDDLSDPEEIVVKPLSAALRTIGLYSGATILGNGEMALVLDPGAIAAQAGIAAHAGEERDTSEEQGAAEEESSEEYLVVRTAGRSFGVPLSCVQRIEQVLRSAIEVVGGQPVLRLGSSVLPVKDHAGAIAMEDQGAEQVVVLCQQGERRFGITVSEVLEVARGELLENAGGEPLPELRLMGARITELLDTRAIAAEVA